MTPMDWVRIEGINLCYLVRLPHTRTYMVMVIELCEWWHNETCTFYLPIGEMTVTLEDVYRIFRLLVRRMPVMAMREMIGEVVM